jgi:hypothetical protein
LLSELVTVNPVPISQQIPRCAVERKSLHDLLRGPLRSRVGRDIEMDDTAAIMREHDEYEQNLEPYGVDCKKVYRSELTEMVGLGMVM